MIVNEKSVGFGLLVGHERLFEDVTFGSDILQTKQLNQLNMKIINRWIENDKIIVKSVNPNLEPQYQCFPHINFPWVGLFGILMVAKIYILTNFCIFLLLRREQCHPWSINSWTVCLHSTLTHVLHRNKEREILWCYLPLVNALLYWLWWYLFHLI